MEQARKFIEGTTLSFARFRVLPYSRQLLADGQPVEVGSRAFDLLLVLINARGNLVTKSEIVRTVWPNTIVEESSLRVQIAALRRVLGRDRNVIKTIPGRGYIFTIDVSVAAQSQPAGMHSGHFATGRPPKVFVVDDDLDVRESLEALLRSAGLLVESFASVAEFLRSAQPDAPGCLVLDVRMPGRSGLDFQDDLARYNVRLPVVFISGHADIPMSVRAMKAGAVEFLTKPLRHQDLLAAVRLAIARYRVDRDDGRALTHLREQTAGD
jgi:DNA-binding response OmpR family regulator